MAFKAKKETTKREIHWTQNSTKDSTKISTQSQMCGGFQDLKKCRVDYNKIMKNMDLNVPYVAPYSML